MTGFCVVKPCCWMRLPPLQVPRMSCVASPKAKKMQEAKNMSPRYINPVQWQQAMGYARQACARIFRDGGSPADAVRAFGLPASEPGADWSLAVDRIAQSLCAGALRKAA